MNANEMTSSPGIIPLELESIEKVADHPDDVDAELLLFFEEEATAEVQSVEKLLHEWDGLSGDYSLKKLRHHFHTLRGAANSIGHVRIGALSGGMEDIFVQRKLVSPPELKAPITKASIAVVLCIRALMQEARQPKFSPVKKEQIIATANMIIDLKRKSFETKGTPA